MANEQVALSFGKGITNVPSDATCDDNALEESLGMVFENGEHRPIQNPRILADNVPITILTVHKTAVSTNYIGFDSSGNLRWGTISNGQFVEGNYKDWVPAEQLTEWSIYPPTDMADQPFIWMRHSYLSDEEGNRKWRYYKCYGGYNIRFYNNVSSEPHDNYEAEDTYFEESAQAGKWYGQHFNEFYGFAKPESAYLGHYNNAEQLLLSVIGDTLVVNAAGGILYFLWGQDDNGNFRYKLLDDIPSLDIEFSLYLSGGHTSEVSAENIATLSYAVNRLYLQKLSTAYDDNILGFYAQNKNGSAEDGRFCLPFFAVAAIEMYDGSYTRITNPVLLLPCIDDNSVIEYNSNTNMLYLRTTACTLYYNLKTSLSEYIDIVKGVSIFVTRGVEIYKTNGTPTRYQDDYPRTTNGIYAQNTTAWNSDLMQYSKLRTETYDDWGQWKYFGRPLDRRTYDDIQYDLYNNANLYKIYEAGIPTTNIWSAVRPLEGALKNLTTQPQLNMVDYFTNTKLQAANMMTYNSRLILSNVRRSFFEGFHLFLPIVQSDMPATYNGAKYSFFVTIKTSQGNKIVRHTVDNYKVMQGYCFFYPDTRAKEVAIYKDGYFLTKIQLSESSGFGGAWALPLLHPSSFHDEGATDQSQPEPEYAGIPNPEKLANTLMVSEVNNPFSFTAKGYYTVGTGEVIALSSLTQALSQGQFGQYPLIVFTTDGIWAMSVANTGYFSAAHPMSRDVCNNIKSIIQTDGAVFFSSEKGLMAIIGNEVRLVSEQLSGKIDSTEEQLSFPKLLASSRIAYDYRDSLLWILPSGSMNRRKIYSQTYKCNINSALYSLGNNKLTSLVGEKLYRVSKISDVSNNLHMEYSGADTQRFMYTGLWELNDRAFKPLEPKEGNIDDVFNAIRTPQSEDGCVAVAFWPKDVDGSRSAVRLFTYEYYTSPAYVYSIKEGTFARYALTTGITSISNNYPDYLLQAGQEVYTLLGRADINDDKEDYEATIITRPMKFDNAMALKSIRQIKNVHYMDGRLTYRLFASNDLKNWIELNSLRSMPWKYYKLRFDFTDMKATDRFAGSVIVTQERRTNKLR